MLILAVVLGFMVFFSLQAHAASPTAQEMDEARRWAAAKFVGQSPDLPFSFVYGGQSSRELLPTWTLERTEEKLDDQRSRRALIYTDPDTRLQSAADLAARTDHDTIPEIPAFLVKTLEQERLRQSAAGPEGAEDVVVEAIEGDEAPDEAEPAAEQARADEPTDDDSEQTPPRDGDPTP